MLKNEDIKISNEVAIELVNDWLDRLKIPKSVIDLDDNKKDSIDKIIAYTEAGLITFNDEKQLIVNLNKTTLLFSKRLKAKDMGHIEKIKTDVDRSFYVISLLTGVSITEIKQLDIWEIGVLNHVIPLFI